MIDTVVAAAVDAFGLTDRGLVRDGNEDHFLIAQISKAIEVRQTSLPPDAIAHEFAGAAGYLLAVADGVGGGPEGDVASERALSAMLSYVGKAATCFQSLDTSAEHALLEKLEAVVHEVHAGLIHEYGGVTSKLPATTLTLVLLVWPRAYHVQVGDSRAYVRRGGRLQRLTREPVKSPELVGVRIVSEVLGTPQRAMGDDILERRDRARTCRICTRRHHDEHEYNGERRPDNRERTGHGETSSNDTPRTV